MPGTPGYLDSTLIANNGTITATDDSGLPEMLTTGALEMIGAGTAISITAETNIVFAASVASLALTQSSPAITDAFNAPDGITFNNTASTVSTAGAALNFTASTGSLTLGNLATAGGGITVTGGSTGGAGNDITLDGTVTVTGGAGSVTLATDNDIDVNAAVSVTGTGGITATADSDGSFAGSFSNDTGATLTTAGGDIVITAAGYDGVSANEIGAAISATTGTNPTTGMPSRVEFLGSTPGVVFDVGTNSLISNAFGLSNAELGFVTAGVLQIGSATNTGGIVIDPTSGATAIGLSSTQVPTLDLTTGGAVTDAGTNAAPPDLTVSNLVVQAGTGIGSSAIPLQTAVGTLTASTAAGGVFVTNDGSLALNGVSTTGAGTVQVTTAGAGAQNLSVNGGQTVSSGTGNIDLTAAGNLTVLGSVATGGAGVITLAAASTVTVSSPTALSSATAVQVDGSGAADTFFLAPQIGAQLDVSGLPTTPLSDTLYINPDGVTGISYTPGAAGAGTFTFANRAAITFTGIGTVVPIVSVAATVPAASESGTAQSVQPGQFTFTRVGDLSAALTVSYAVGGTAASGTDFQPLSGQVTFAAGAATATATVTPVAAAAAGPLTVTVSLDASTGYTFATGAAATVTIANDTVVYNTVAYASATGAVTVVRNGTAVFTNFNPGFTGPVAVAVGDVNGDGVPDVVIAGLVNGTDVVAVFDGATQALLNLFVPLPGYSGGLSLAVGDVLGTGRADIVVGLSTAPAFGIFDGLSGALVTAVVVFPGVNVGVNVAVGDLNGTGTPDVIVTPTGIAPLVSIYDGSGHLLNSFFAFSPAVAGVGLTVAAGDIEGTGTAEIVLGVQVNGFDYVVIYNSDLTLRAILPLVPSATPPQVAVGDVNGDGRPELLVTVGAIFGAFDGQTLELVEVLAPFPGQPGAVNIG